MDAQSGGGEEGGVGVHSQEGCILEKKRLMLPTHLLLVATGSNRVIDVTTDSRDAYLQLQIVRSIANYLNHRGAERLIGPP